VLWSTGLIPIWARLVGLIPLEARTLKKQSCII
jgi:hypothetical protein